MIIQTDNVIVMPPMPLSPGPQSSNCTWNPTFCTFRQAQISDCTLDLLLGSGDVTDGGVTMHMGGQALLKASLARPLKVPNKTRLGSNGSNRLDRDVSKGCALQPLVFVWSKHAARAAF